MARGGGSKFEIGRLTAGDRAAGCPQIRVDFGYDELHVAVTEEHMFLFPFPTPGQAAPCSDELLR